MVKHKLGNNKNDHNRNAKPQQRNFTVIAMIIVAGIALTACSLGGSNKQFVPTAIQHGHSIAQKSVERYLTGQIVASDQGIKSAKSQYSKLGDFCNVARLYLLHYQVRGLDNISFVDNANTFATLGNCNDELNIVNFIYGNDYVESQLPMFYQALAHYDRNDYSHQEFVETVDSNKDLKAFTKTAGIRLAVSRMLNDPATNIQTTEQYITTILIPTDEAFSYTTNLVKDYKLLRAVYNQQGRNVERIDETIELIDREINYIR